MINSVEVGDVLLSAMTGSAYVITKADFVSGQYIVSYERYEFGILVDAGDYYGLDGWHVKLIGRNYQKKAES